MKLFTSLPARKDGTLMVENVPSGVHIIFTGMPLTADVEDEGDIEHLQALGFMDEDSFLTEQKFLAQQSERESRRIARGLPAAEAGRAADDEDEDFVAGGTGSPQEENTPTTGRVRKARR